MRPGHMLISLYKKPRLKPTFSKNKQNPTS